MIDKRELAAAVRTAFRALLASGKLQTIGVADDQYGASARLSNERVELRIRCERPLDRVFLSIHRLDRGPIPSERDMRDRLRDPLNGFDINDLIAIRLGEPEPAAFERIERGGVDDVLSYYATQLPLVGSDLLDGDFSVFSDLSARVARRVQARADAGQAVGPDGSAIIQAAQREGLL